MCDDNFPPRRKQADARTSASEQVLALQPFSVHASLYILGHAGLAPPQLTAGLVEPCSHTVLPVLVEVPVREDVVVLHAAGQKRKRNRSASAVSPLQMFTMRICQCAA